MQYLLDTNICVFILRQKYGVGERLLQEGVSKCFISRIRVIPIKDAIPLFAREKARLRKGGMLVDDFDLLIGTTAVKFDLTMVTENIRHFQNIDGIKLDNWVVR